MNTMVSRSDSLPAQRLLEMARTRGWDDFKVVCENAPLVPREFVDKGWRIKPSGVHELVKEELPAFVQQRVQLVMESGLPIQGWVTLYEPKQQIANRPVYLTQAQVELGRKVLVAAGVTFGVIVGAVASVMVLAVVVSALLPILVLGGLFLGMATVDPVLVACVGDDPEHCTYVQIAAWLDEE